MTLSKRKQNSSAQLKEFQEFCAVRQLRLRAFTRPETGRPVGTEYNHHHHHHAPAFVTHPER